MFDNLDASVNNLKRRYSYLKFSEEEDCLETIKFYTNAVKKELLKLEKEFK